ncbi:unnamed protein product [Euphydryas editha]|uniref:Transposase n=1 Tax=Euphydryas editha TaxID=104508 RepID=A0AAU9TYH1_EUPED|nr:unnamed protein product [Euphydryas editha]
MDSKNFKKWLTEKLIPNLPQNSLVVIDNASYHSTQCEKPPVSLSLKALEDGQILYLLQQSNFEDDEDDPFGGDDTDDEYLPRRTRASDSRTSSESEPESQTPFLQRSVRYPFVDHFPEEVMDILLDLQVLVVGAAIQHIDALERTPLKQGAGSKPSLEFPLKTPEMRTHRKLQRSIDELNARYPNPIISEAESPGAERAQGKTSPESTSSRSPVKSRPPRVLTKVRQAVNAKEKWVKVERVMKARDRKIVMRFGTKEERVKVKERLEWLVQCSKCLGYGHSRKFCSEQADACSHCGGPHLKTKCADWIAVVLPACRNGGRSSTLSSITSSTVTAQYGEVRTT